MKKVYSSPSAEIILFVPFETIAAAKSWKWNWGDITQADKPTQVSGVNGTVVDIWKNPWDYNNSNDPY